MRETRDHAIAFTDLSDSTRLFRELGDGVMCAFADAERTVLAMSALHAQMAARRLSERLVRIHSGISYGSVILEGEDIFGTIVNVAAYLAAIARTDQILATQPVADRLSAPTRACARATYSARLKGDDRESLVHEILWQTDRAGMTAINPSAVRVLPADEGALQFQFAGTVHRLTAFQPTLSFGRDPDSAVVVADEFVSRVHAVAEVDTMRFKLIDRSANGTYVAIDGTPGEARVLRGETVLHGSGRISLGRPLADPLAQPIVFRRDQRALFRV